MKTPGGETGQRTSTIAQLSPSVQNGDELRMALRHPENEAVPLLRWLARELGKPLPYPLPRDKGVVCDLRPEHEDKEPSLSYGNKATGAVFRRFGNDDRGFSAVEYVSKCLGISKGEAAKRLIERAGLPEMPSAIRIPKKPASSATYQPKTQPEAEKTVPITKKELENTLKFWKPASSDHPEIVRRGFGVALETELLHAYVKGIDLAFEIRGPDGEIYAIKRRGGRDGVRYSYLTKGKGTPAWCSPNLTAATAELWVEGELNAVAVAQALSGTGYGLQGMAGAGGKPHVQHLQGSQKPIYIYADPDDAGRKARVEWEKQARALGLLPIQLPEALFHIEGHDLSDACDVLGQLGEAILLKRLNEALELARPPAGDIYVDDEHGYGVRDGRLVALRKQVGTKGEVSVSEEVLTEFIAYIIEECQLHNGLSEPEQKLVLEGWSRDGQPFTAKRAISVEEFQAMNWPMVLGGTEAIVHAGQGRKDRARVCIQVLSKRRGVKKSRIMTHTGWHKEQGQPVYLTAGAVIGANGVVDGVQVALDDRLSKIALPAPPSAEVQMEVVMHTLGLLDLAPPEVNVPTLGALYRSVLGKSDNMVVLVGPTGTAKTTFLSLLMAHMGAGFSRQYLPSGWQSSANALENLAFCAKDALLLIDDYKPNAGQPKQVAQTLSRLIQGMADGAGRATLTAERKARPNTFPRGTVMTSAEEFPTGESNQARTLLVPLNEPLLGRNNEHSQRFFDAEDLASQGIYALAMAGYIQFIAQRYEMVQVGSKAHKAHIREISQLLRGGHGRTGMAAAELSYGWRVWLNYAVHCGAMHEDDATSQWEVVLKSLQEVVSGQQEYHQTQNPADRFLQILGTLLLQGKVYLEDAKAGGCPSKKWAVSAGWRCEKRMLNETKTTDEFVLAPQAEKVGWVGEADGHMWAYFMPQAVYSVVQRACSQQQQPALPSQQALWSALRDCLHPNNLMRCAVETRGGGKKLVRPLKKVRVQGLDGHPQLLNLRFPLEILLDNSGHDSDSATIKSAKPDFPPLAFFT